MRWKEFNLPVRRDAGAFLPTDRTRKISRQNISTLSGHHGIRLAPLYVRVADLGRQGEVMLRSANEFKDFSIGATDGDIGRVEGFYFDDRQWTVRYIIVNTGSWFNESKVLVSPYAVDGTNWNSRTIETALTRESERAPGPLCRKPSAQYQ